MSTSTAGEASPSGENHPVSIDHYENFPVASVLCPPAIRPAVTAIYHFARTADDIADEGTAQQDARLQDLAAYRRDLVAVSQGQPVLERWQHVFAPLGRSIDRDNLPLPPLHALLDAFEQDARNPRYADRAALLAYCSKSANPVGRLLLHLYGIDDPLSLQQSDAVCSALQLINFWQDLSVDGLRGRCYVPETDRMAHGVDMDDLLRARDSAAAQRMVRALCAWAQQLMLQGAPLALRVPGRAGWELRLVVQGGLRILERIGQMNHATLAARPTLSAFDVPVLAWRALWMRRSSR